MNTHPNKINALLNLKGHIMNDMINIDRQINQIITNQKLKFNNISFSTDFDGTLTIPAVQIFVKYLQENGATPIIVTSRYDDFHAYRNKQNPSNDDLYLTAHKIGIPRNQIVFTNRQPKVNYLNHSFFLFHLEDNQTEIELLLNSAIHNKHCPSPININSPNFNNTALDIIERYINPQENVTNPSS